MRAMYSFLFALLLASCTNDRSTPSDAMSADTTSSVCTRQLYDACNAASSNCTTGLMCKSFTASSFAVCTQTCGTCPDQGANPVTCNAMGICKPNAPNACTPP
jgi:hypothetical protein